MTFDERIEISGRSYNSQVFLWDYTQIQLFSPIAILNCPIEIVKLKFKPDNQNWLLGGAINGQIILWDLTGKFQNLEILSKNNDLEFVKIDPVLISMLQEPYNIPPLFPTEPYSRKSVNSH